MAAPTTGLGAIFSLQDGTTYNDIGEVISIQPPGVTAETIDTTELNPTDAFRTFIKSLKDGGEVTVVMHMDPATVADAENQSLLKAEVEGTDNSTAKIEFSDAGPNVIFSGPATGWTPGELTADGKIELTFTMKVSGKPIWADS